MCLAYSASHLVDHPKPEPVYPVSVASDHIGRFLQDIAAAGSGESVLEHKQVFVKRTPGPYIESPHLLDKVVLPLHNQFSRRRRSRRPEVSDKIAYGKINLMAYRGNYRYCRPCN